MSAKKAAPTGPRFYAYPLGEHGEGWILRNCAEPGHNLTGAPAHFATAAAALDHATERGWGPKRSGL